MAEKLVSILVPAFNRERYIEECIRSALDQTYSNIEVIVIDDGSSDKTLEKLNLIKDEDRRIKILTHPGNTNQGQSASLNLGLKHAKGEYINILDSDDLLHTEKLATQVPFMEQNQEIGLVYSNGYRIGADGNKFDSYHQPDHHEPNDPDLILLDCYMHLPVNSLVRKKLYDQVGGFEETFKAAQDHDMLLRLAENTRLAYLPDHLFSYRMHEDSISGSRLRLRWQTGFEILRRARQRYPYRKGTVRKRLAVLNYRLGQVYLQEQLLFKAIARFAIAGALDPFRAAKVALGYEKKN